jgi:hypothetical protein
MKHFLYRTTCLINDKYYVGIHSTESLNDGYLGSGRHIKAAIRKYGDDKFEREILCFGTRDYIKDLEIAYVNEQLLMDPMCMNHALGGQGGSSVSLCRTKESYIHSHVKACITKKGRTKENHLGIKTQAEKLRGRSKDTHQGYKKVSEFRKTRIGEQASNVKLTDVQRIEIYALWKSKVHPREIQKCYQFMTISGIKTSIYREKAKEKLLSTK